MALLAAKLTSAASAEAVVRGSAAPAALTRVDVTAPAASAAVPVVLPPVVTLEPLILLLTATPVCNVVLGLRSLRAIGTLGTALDGAGCAVTVAAAQIVVPGSLGLPPLDSFLFSLAVGASEFGCLTGDVFCSATRQSPFPSAAAEPSPASFPVPAFAGGFWTEVPLWVGRFCMFEQTWRSTSRNGGMACEPASPRGSASPPELAALLAAPVVLKLVRRLAAMVIVTGYCTSDANCCTGGPARAAVASACKDEGCARPHLLFAIAHRS